MKFVMIVLSLETTPTSHSSRLKGQSSQWQKMVLPVLALCGAFALTASNSDNPTFNNVALGTVSAYFGWSIQKPSKPNQ
jgi:hypothetical protein